MSVEPQKQEQELTDIRREFDAIGDESSFVHAVAHARQPNDGTQHSDEDYLALVDKHMSDLVKISLQAAKLFVGKDKRKHT